MTIWLVISFILLFGLALVRPRLALGLVLTLVPTFLVRFDIRGIPTTWLEIAIYTLALAWLLTALRQRQFLSTITETYHEHKLWLLPLLIWLLTAIAATIASPDLRLSAGVLKGWWFDPLLLIWLVMIHTRRRRDIRNWLLALLLMAAGVSLYGLIEYVFNFGMQADGLVNSVFKPANYVALLVVPVICLGLGWLLADRTDRRRRLLISLLIAISMVALVLTKSYGGLLGLAAGIGTLALFIQSAQTRRRVLIGFIALGLIAGGLVMTQDKFQRIAGGSERNSLTTRLQIWEISTEVLTRHWLWGVGLGNFQQPYRTQAYLMYQPPLEWEVVKAHNLYLNTWLEMGLFGLLAFLYLLIIFAVSAARAVFALVNKPDWWLLAGSVAALVSQLTHGLLDTPYFKNDLAIVFLFSLLLPSLLLTVAKNENSSQR